MIKRGSLLLSAVVGLLLLSGCEDDPILEPTGDDGGGGGSYGQMNWMPVPDSAATSAGLDRAPANPELF